jgi:hypothetical protein
MLIQELYGQLQADADACTQPPVQMCSTELVMVTDPPCSAEQNACPDESIMHFPGPQSIWPSRFFTIPPYGGEQAILPSMFFRQVPPCGGQAIFPSILRTQGLFSSDQAVTVNKSVTKKMITDIRAAFLICVLSSKFEPIKPKPKSIDFSEGWHS